MDLQVDPKYFDYAASMPIWPEAMDSFMQVSQECFANPSSIHGLGRSSKRKLQELRKELCDLTKFYDGRFLLCSSGTEANNLVVEGHLEKYPETKILIGEDVHDSIWYAAKKHSNRARIIPLDKHGLYRLDKMRKLVSSTSMVYVNHACNETGVIQDVQTIAELCQETQVQLLIDGMQSFGHIDVDLNALPCTYYTISGHKFGAVRGTGGVFMRDNDFMPQLQGGRQEWELRAGTENVAGLASMVTAFRMCLKDLEQELGRLKELTDQLINKLKNIVGAKVNSSPNGLPGFVSISFPGYSGRELGSALSISGFAVSTGSACHANEMSPSRVLLAMGRTKEEATGAIRISMGRSTTESAVDELVNKISELVA